MSLLRHRRADDEITAGSTDDSQTLPQHHNNNGVGYNEKNSNQILGLMRIKTGGESGRSGFHPLHFARICFRSTCTLSMIVNVLWPFVPAAFAVGFARPDLDVWIFALNYIAIIPTANLLGFAGGELAGKLPRVYGVLLETTLTSVVEIILFMVLIKTDKGTELIDVIQAAILGSILANLLLCLGMCFFFGGLRRDEQVLHEAVSEVGSGLLLVAGFGLLIPSAFHATLSGSTTNAGKRLVGEELELSTRKVSRATAIILLCAYFMFLWYNLRTHNTIFDEVLKKEENKDGDESKEHRRPKLTLLESVLATLLAIGCVSLSAYFLVEQIPNIVARGVPDNFMGLILVPLVEKAAEHLTAVDEAWDDQINFALFHCLGPSIQTALFNAPLVVLVGWGLDKPMDLNFEIFMVVLLVLSILVVGNFLRDGKSNYMEGGLCVLVYVIIAVTTWYYP